MTETTPGDEAQPPPQSAPQPAAPQPATQAVPAASSSRWSDRMHRLRATRLRLTSVLAAVGFLLLGGVAGFGLAQAVDDSGNGHRPHGPEHSAWQDGGRYRDGGPGQGQGPQAPMPRPGGGGPNSR